MYERSGASRKDDSALSALSRAVDALAGHLGEVQKLDIRALTTVLVEEIAEVYRRFQDDRNMTVLDQEEAIAEVFAAHALDLTDDGTAELSMEASAITEARGPLEAATINVAHVFNVSTRTMYNWRSQDRPHPGPSAFQGRAGRIGKARYALQALGFDEPAIEAALHELRQHMANR